MPPQLAALPMTASNPAFAGDASQPEIPQTELGSEEPPQEGTIFDV